MFVHLADIHIGQTYRGKKFFNWSLFKETINRIIELNPEFVLISGDLFDKPLVDNETLIETLNLLNKLKNKGIPIFTIEGNHDCNNTSLSYYYLFSQLGVINNLSSGDKIGFLKRKYESEFVEFKEVKIKDKTFYKAKGVLDLNKIKEIHGIAYIRTKEMLNLLLKEFRDVFFNDKNILMLHQSVETISGIPKEFNEITIEELSKLGYKYYALGHIHKSNVLNNNYLFKNSFFVYSGSLDLTDKNLFHKIEFIKELKIKKQKTGFIVSDLQNIKFEEVQNSNYYDVYLEFSDLNELKAKLEKINEVIGEGEAIIELFTLNKVKRERVFDLIEEVFKKEKIIDINYNFYEEKEEVEINEFSFNKINSLLDQFETIKESSLSKETIRLKVLELIKDLDIKDLANEIENIEKKSELKKINKEILKKEKEMIELTEEDKSIKKGILQFLERQKNTNLKK